MKKEVFYPWEINIVVSCMIDVHEQKLARTKQIAQLKRVPNSWLKDIQ